MAILVFMATCLTLYWLCNDITLYRILIALVTTVMDLAVVSQYLI